MSHEFSSGVFAGNRPAWHRLGVVLPQDKLDTQEALQYSGLAGWDLYKDQVFSKQPDFPIEGHYAVTRSDTGSVLGVVGEHYNIVQNEEAFRWMDELIGGEGFHYETAGSLRGGRIVWLLAKAPFTVDLPDSPIDTYVLLANSHDGSRPLTVAITPIRVVCWNTLSAALWSSEKSYRIRHTISARSKLAEAQRVLGLAEGAAIRVRQEAERMSRHTLTTADFCSFLEKLVLTPPEGQRAQTIAGKKRAAISDIYHHAVDQRPIRGTAWGAFNAVVAYNDHHVKSRSTLGTAEENRMERIMLADPATSLTGKALALLR